MNLNCIKKKIEGGPSIPALYTKPPSKSYKLVESHDFYVKDPRQIPPSLPPPRPPIRSKSETIDIVEYLLVDDKAIKVPLSVLSKPIDGLVTYLIDGYDDDMSKVRVLFRWLGNQPIHRMHVLDKQPSNKDSALYNLWLLRTKKQRYTKLFSLLCRYAGLYCVIVHGAVKGIHYQIGEKIDIEKHYGEWNAVCVDGDWRFVDALWGACDVKDPGDGRGRFHCDERFFLTDPKDLLFTHFAHAPRWQLLDSPRHIEAFEESACLKNRFFELGMQVLSHPLCEIVSEDGEVDILFGIRPKQGSEQRFNCYISHFDRPDTKRYLTRGSNTSVPIFIHKLTESSISVKVRFPESGVFRLEIVGKQLTKGSLYKEYDWISVYKVLVEEPSERGFPKMDLIGWGPGNDVVKIGLAPFNYTSGIIVAKNVQTKIRFKIMDTNVVQNMKFFFKMSSTYDNDFSVNAVSDKFEVDVNIMTFFIDAPPFGEYTLKMYARNVRGNVPMEQRREINVCNYLLISDIQQRSSPLGILTEKTEIADDPPEVPKQPPIPKQPPFQKQPPAPKQPPMPHVHIHNTEVTAEHKSDVAESIVSASNVMMDSNSHPADSPCNSPEIPDVPFVDEAKSPEPVIQVSFTPKSAPKKSQSFVRVDADMQEIPEIPLKVVKAVQSEVQTQRSSEKRELKVVSSNRVVPLVTTGGDDGSVVLVPENKSKRPTTGVRRSTNKSRDDTKYYTALARVRGETAAN